jgi:hypothetical protein
MDIAGLTWPSNVPRLLLMRRECPLCSSLEFKIAESQPLDRLLKLLMFCPVRCANCWRRYYWFAKEARIKHYSSEHME